MPSLKNLLTTTMLSASFLLLSPVAHAQASSGWWSRVRSWWQDLMASWESNGGGSGSAVPELDPSAAGAAIAVLLLGVAYIASRRREGEH